NSATVNITVGTAPVPPAPVPVNDTAATIQSSVVAIDATANDANCSAVTPCAVAIAIPPVSGSAVANSPGNGMVIYTPYGNYTGQDSFSYTATNAGGASATSGTVIVNVSPNPVTDVVTITGGDLKNGILSVNGTVSAQNSVYAAQVAVYAGACSGSSLGAAAVNTLGAWSFSANVAAPVSTVCVVSVNGGVAQASVKVAVASPPVIASTPTLSAMVGKSYAYKVTASDADGGPLSFTLDQAPAGMTIRPSSGFVAWVGWRPVGTQTGVQDVTVRVTDPTGLFTTQSYRIAVPFVNSPPQVSNDVYTMIKGGTLNVAAPGVLANDRDPDIGDTLTAAKFTTPLVGTLAGRADGGFSYTPPANFTGTTRFGYLARDNKGLASKTAGFVSIAVRANRVPATVDDVVSTPLNTPLAINVLGNDSDPDTAIDPSNRIDPTTLFIPAGKQPDKGGTVTLNANGTIGYTPKPGFIGIETFMYAAGDTYGTPGISRATKVSVNVVSEAINFIRSEYLASQRRLRAEGSIYPAASQIVLLNYIGANGTVLGVAGGVVADALGNWTLDAIAVLPAGTTMLRVTSPNGVVQFMPLTLL
ncbi:MAG TPA: Ig-like domain-containing protein, partial [Gallionella sp.]|nr:Ig-like domain-containing protein [Gallionella sp.]